VRQRRVRRRNRWAARVRAEGDQEFAAVIDAGTALVARGVPARIPQHLWDERFRRKQQARMRAQEKGTDP